jgi:hypothetical protein
MCGPLLKPDPSALVQFHAGNNVLCGKDYTLFSLHEGVVVFETIKRKKCVCPSKVLVATFPSRHHLLPSSGPFGHAC